MRPKPNIQGKTPTARLKPKILLKIPSEILQPRDKSIEKIKGPKAPFKKYGARSQQRDLNPKYKSRPQQKHFDPGRSLFKKQRGWRPLLRHKVQNPNCETVNPTTRP